MARTRSASAHRKVLDAALALFAERGIEGASMDAVAEHSGVSKATIYKNSKFWGQATQLPNARTVPILRNQELSSLFPGFSLDAEYFVP